MSSTNKQGLSSQRNYSSSSHSDQILIGLKEQRNEGVLCDLQLDVGGEQLPVHRCVLVACSEYFRAMLTGSMKESRQNVVELRGLSLVGVKAMVDFAYSGSLSIDIHINTVEEVLEAACHLQVTAAISLCCSFITDSLSVENCVDYLNLTDTFSLLDTKQHIKGFMLKNFERLATSSQFNKLKGHELMDLLKSNALQVISEYRLFELTLRWIENDKLNRLPHLFDLMQCIRLPLLSGEELVEKVSKVKLMRSNPLCLELLTHAKDYHIVVNRQPLLQSERTQVRSDSCSLIMLHNESLESYDFSTGEKSFLKDAIVPMFKPRVCVVDNFLYACGGKYDRIQNNEIATARLFRYDPRFDTWLDRCPMLEARQDFCLLPCDGQLYAVGGRDENVIMCSCESYSIKDDEWNIKQEYHTAVYGHAGAEMNGRLYVSGGQAFDQVNGTVMSYSPGQDGWRSEPSLGHPRANHSMVAVSNILYVMGGDVEDYRGFPVPVTSIEMLLPGFQVWTLCKATLNAKDMGLVLQKGDIYIVGGKKCTEGRQMDLNMLQAFNTSTQVIELVDLFTARLHGRASCLLTLPHYV